MARIDRGRIEAAAAPVVEIIETRFDDLDMQGHVNNSKAVVLLQEARARFNQALGLPGMIQGRRAMVASLHVDYVRELHHLKPVEISTTVLSLGRSSFMLGQVARQDGKGALYSETVVVLADANGPAPLPEDLRAAYSARLSVADRE